MFRIVLSLSVFLLILCCATSAPATTKAELCASAGDYSDVMVKSRDLGRPLTEAMQLIDKRARLKHYPKASVEFMRWTVLQVYTYNAFDDTRLRQLVEVKCYEYAW
jgi:hypothetical protein